MQMIDDHTEMKTPPPVPATKTCPFCAETILQKAIKCKHCGEFLDQRPSSKKGKWMFSTGAIILGLLTIGPLALPLVWLHPRWSRLVKTAITIAVIILTGLLCWASMAMYNNLIRQIKSLGL